MAIFCRRSANIWLDFISLIAKLPDPNVVFEPILILSIIFEPRPIKQFWPIKVFPPVAPGQICEFFQFSHHVRLLLQNL